MVSAFQRARQRHWPFVEESSPHMDGTFRYAISRWSKPGIVATVRLFPGDAQRARDEFREAYQEAFTEGQRVGRNEVISLLRSVVEAASPIDGEFATCIYCGAMEEVVNFEAVTHHHPDCEWWQAERYLEGEAS